MTVMFAGVILLLAEKTLWSISQTILFFSIYLFGYKVIS